MIEVKPVISSRSNGNTTAFLALQSSASPVTGSEREFQPGTERAVACRKADLQRLWMLKTATILVRIGGLLFA